MSKTRRASNEARGTKRVKSVKAGVGQRFRDYNPMGVDPNSEQFEPTDASPIRRAHRQAGVS